MGFPGLVWGGEKRERSLSVTSVESDHFTLSQQDPWARIFPNVLHKREGGERAVEHTGWMFDGHVPIRPWEQPSRLIPSECSVQPDLVSMMELTLSGNTLLPHWEHPGSDLAHTHLWSQRGRVVMRMGRWWELRRRHGPVQTHPGHMGHFCDVQGLLKMIQQVTL